MIEIGQVVTLNNDKEYIITDIIEVHSLKYVCLLSNFKPLDIIIATVKEKDNNIIFDEVKTNDELDYVLSRMVLTKEFD